MVGEEETVARSGGERGELARVQHPARVCTCWLLWLGWDRRGHWLLWLMSCVLTVVKRVSLLRRVERGRHVRLHASAPAL